MTWHTQAQAHRVSQENGNVLLMQATQQRYRHFLDQLAPGYRVQYFNAQYFEPMGEIVCGAVFETNTKDHGVSHQFGISWGELVNRVAALYGIAEVMQVDSYNDDDGRARYAYIAYHKPNPAESFVITYVNPIFIGQMEGGLNTDWNVSNRTSAGPYSNVTAPYEDDNTYTFAPDHSRFFDQFEACYSALSQQGFRQISLEFRNDQSLFPNTYLPVFKSDGNLVFSTEKNCVG
ncbi:MAG: hypothetical protein AAF989_08855 [Planctomycetota bacterium]